MALRLTPYGVTRTSCSAWLNHTRVACWESAKFVANLRTLKTDDNPLLLNTNFVGSQR